MMTSISAEAVIAALALQPHPEEGGFFRETYRADEVLPASALAGRYHGPRVHGTAIYYLLTQTVVSAVHRLESDEVFHFYLGDAVQQLRLFPDGQGEIVVFGSELSAGQQLQSVVPRGVWQGARLAPGGTFGFALLGCTVAPGFEYADYSHGTRTELVQAYPEWIEEIVRLTPGG